MRCPARGRTERAQLAQQTLHTPNQHPSAAYAFHPPTIRPPAHQAPHPIKSAQTQLGRAAATTSSKWMQRVVLAVHYMNVAMAANSTRRARRTQTFYLH